MVMDPAAALELTALERHRGINEAIDRGDSDVQKFYDNGVAFITGGSGFLGKQLIEKLLRSCKLKKVYILLRSKKQKTVEKRLEEILRDPVYDYLHKNQSNFVNKLVLIEGDVTDLRLGISDDNWTQITENVDFIFHGAATINFSEPLKAATLTNVRGTRELLKLAKACKKIRSIVHISTAYSHATRDRIGGPVREQFYRSPMPPNTLIELAEYLDENTLDNMTTKLIENWPNTYSFTKAVAEEAVRTVAGELPICIVRPAIVISALREPLPGWIDQTSAYGPSGFILGSALGVLHVLHADQNINLDLVPVDLVNNCVIAAAAETAARGQRGDTDIQIYTVTGTRNPISMGKMVSSVQEMGSKIHTAKSVWYCYALMTGNMLVHNIMTLLLHYIPGYMVDSVLVLLGKQRLLMKVYKKAYKLNSALKYFMTNDWQFDDSNLLALYRHLGPVDRTIFQCNMAAVDWTEYLTFWCIGIRKYIIKDELKNTEYAVKRQVWLRIANYVFLSLYFFTFWKLLYFIYSVVSYIFIYILYTFIS